MKKPTLEEVKSYFKDAKIIKSDRISAVDITKVKLDKRGIHTFLSMYWLDYTDNHGVKRAIKLWSEHLGYAEILETKQNKMREKILLEEAKRKGFVKGAKFISPKSLGNSKVQTVEQEPFFFYSNGIAAKDHEGVIYLEGEWGTLVEDAKKVVAYLLKDDKYLKAVEAITGLALLDYKSDIAVRTENHVHGNTFSYRKLKEAEVLDLWFEPVYGEVFKVGDIAVRTVENGGVHSKGKVFKIDEVIKNQKGEITSLREKEDKEVKHMPSSCRLATFEEIEEYNRKLPTLCGYKGKDMGNSLCWGCFHVNKEDIYDLIRLQIKSFVIHAGGEDVKVSEENFRKIEQYLNINK